jgi:hypothetical protein
LPKQGRGPETGPQARPAVSPASWATLIHACLAALRRMVARPRPSLFPRSRHEESMPVAGGSSKAIVSRKACEAIAGLGTVHVNVSACLRRASAVSSSDRDFSSLSSKLTRTWASASSLRLARPHRQCGAFVFRTGNGEPFRLAHQSAHWRRIGAQDGQC